MKLAQWILLAGAVLAAPVIHADQAVVDRMLQAYAQQGATSPSARNGEQLWVKVFPGKGQFSERSCSNCHSQDLRQAGKHVRTGKAIEPMSPMVNAERLSDGAKIEKWFKRNCKWTLGRECSPQEKADFLLYINSARNI
jgi:hypothetical protein